MTQIDLLREFFKKKGAGSLFTRRELLRFFETEGGLSYKKSSGAVSVDTNLAYLRYAGYIQREAYGVTKILKLIPEGHKQYDIYKEGHENKENVIKPRTNMPILFDEAVKDCEALSQQIGGSHYKDLAIQPIVLIVKGGFSFIQGNIIKYVSRYNHKNGIEDLKKAAHYAKMAKELDEKPGRIKYPELIDEYCKANNFKGYVSWTLNQAAARKWDRVIEGCGILIKELEEANKSSDLL